MKSVDSVAIFHGPAEISVPLGEKRLFVHPRLYPTKKVFYLWFLSIYDSWLSNICFSYIKCCYSLFIPELTSNF